MRKSLISFIIILNVLFTYGQQSAGGNLPLSTQLTISKATVFNQNNEVLKVFLIVNASNQTKGTGFLIKSGRVITNAHVVNGANVNQLELLSPNGLHYAVNKVIQDTVRDLAIITLQKTIAGGFELGDDNTTLIGSQVYTWGFPLGYNGPSPLLSVGYLAGVVAYQPYFNKFTKHLVVNGAFNGGNSGGPLITGGKVVGIVQSKNAPITPYIASALQALKNNQSGVVYTGTDGTGKPIQFSEGQVIGQILTYYRELSQVMIGEAVSVTELKKFLDENNITGY